MKEIALLRGLNEVNRSAFNHDGTMLAISDIAGNFMFWNTRDWSMIRTFHLDQEVHFVLFSKDDTRLFVQTGDHRIRILDSTSGREILVLSLPASPVFGPALSHDGRWLAQGMTNGQVRLWDGD